MSEPDGDESQESGADERENVRDERGAAQRERESDESVDGQLQAERVVRVEIGPNDGMGIELSLRDYEAFERETVGVTREPGLYILARMPIDEGGTLDERP